ncbi:MAG: nucleoside hydrolase [Erysipelotrichaceae bacterium]|nr:nucleoside hydrolase [Erysipelotrichaceae bacterium]
MNKVWFDTDIGVDDAVALLCAYKLEDIEIVGISAVAGNAYVDDVFNNARNVTYLANKDVKVYKGASKPLLKDNRTAPIVHGKNGLGDVIIPTSPAPIEEKDAIDAIYEKAKELNGELKVVAVGPLTNIALVLRKYPDFKDYCKEIYIMGGTAVGGNATPCSEFNIYADPQAAYEVFESGIFVHMFGLDVTLKANIHTDEIAEIGTYGNKASDLFRDSLKLVVELYKTLNVDGTCIHDACPIFYLVHPEIFKGEQCGIFVEPEGKYTTGQTVCDLYSNTKYEDRHCKLYTYVDRDAFVNYIKECYKQY